MLKALLVSSIVLNLGLLLGRLSGFAREMFVANAYGATADADVVVLMLTVPDFLVNILMGGALGAALIPEFTRYPERSRGLLYQAFLLLGAIFLIIACGFYWQSEMLVNLLVPGFSSDQVARASEALRWVIWLIPLTVLAGVVTAYLHSQNRFAVAALGTLIINCSIICGLYLSYSGYGSLYLVALFVLIGGGVRLLSQLVVVKCTFSPIHGLSKIYINRELLVRYGQAMLSGGALLLFPVAARAIGSYYPEGSVALLNYATRLIEFPLAVAVTFVAAILFPRLSKSYNEKSEMHSRLVGYGAQVTLLLSLVAAIMLSLLSDSYAALVYGHGQMSELNVSQVSSLVSIGLLALPFQGLSSFLTTVFNARKDTRTPMVINGAGLIFFLVVASTGLFGNSLESLLLSLVVSYALICVTQVMLLKVEGMSWKSVLFRRSFVLGVSCSSVMLAYATIVVRQNIVSDWLSLVVASICAALSLVIVFAFSEDVRTYVKARIISR